MANARMKPETRPLEIAQQQVDEYARLNSMCRDLTKQRDELRDKILTAMKSGATCPTGGPWLITLTTQERCAHEWKSICSQVIDLLPTALKIRANELVAVLQGQKKPVSMLTVNVNPTWER